MRPTSDTAPVPALASLALASRLNSSPRPARVVGVAANVAWCALDDEVVFLAPTVAARFPNAILASAGWDRLEPGDVVVIGSDAVIGQTIAWRVVRWWNPRVAPIAAKPNDVAAGLSLLERTLPESSLAGLEAALASCDGAAVLDGAVALLGAGRGLTPEGDDGLIGAVAAFRHMTTSLGYPAAARMIDDVANDVVSVATEATTGLSVTLLRHAFAGEMADPVAGLLRALTGRGDVGAALERCLCIGASSGRALALGVLCGARAGYEAAS